MTKTLDQSINAALTEMKAPSTTANQPNMQAWAAWFRFQTLKDPQLEQMVTECARFVRDIKSGAKPRWLTLAGACGVGKTFLAKRIYRWVCESHIFQTTTMNDDEFSYSDEWLYWETAAKGLQRNEDPIFHTPRTKFAVIDDIGASRDNTGHATNQLAILLGQRVNKWTLITTNLNLQQIAERIDQRVASRIIRDGNTVVEVDAPDFALRNCVSQNT